MVRHSVFLFTTEEPRTAKEVLNSSEKTLWKNTMVEELNSLIHNQVWKLTTLPLGKKSVKSMWALKKKKYENGKTS